MSALDDVKAAAGYGVTAIETIESVLGVLDIGGAAAEVATTVEAILRSFVGGVNAGTSPADISADIAKLAQGLGANDKAADAAVAAKFPAP